MAETIPVNAITGKPDPAAAYLPVLRSLGATRVWEAREDDPREKQLLADLREIAMRRGIQTPPLLIYESDKPNAVSMPGAVAVATNLIDITTPKQLKAVIGHELSHTRHRLRDMPIMIAIAAAVGYAFSHLMQWITQRHPPQNTATRAAVFIGREIGPPVAAMLAVKPYGRMMEYEADKEGAEMAGPEAMAGALSALHKRSGELHAEDEAKRQKHYESMPGWKKTIADAYDTVEPSWLKRIRRHPLVVFDFHPAMKDRLAALKAMPSASADEQTLPSDTISR